MKKDASRFSPKGVLFHRTFFTAPHIWHNLSRLFLLGVEKSRSPFFCENLLKLMTLVQTGCNGNFINRGQASSSSKNAGLFCELKKAKAFLISQGKICNVFLTKMDALQR